MRASLKSFFLKNAFSHNLDSVSLGGKVGLWILYELKEILKVFNLKGGEGIGGKGHK